MDPTNSFILVRLAMSALLGLGGNRTHEGFRCGHECWQRAYAYLSGLGLFCK
jgi:hypothetical protein